jgi:hypothetical protein
VRVLSVLRFTTRSFSRFFQAHGAHTESITEREYRTILCALQ